MWVVVSSGCTATVRGSPFNSIKTSVAVRVPSSALRVTEQIENRTDSQEQIEELSNVALL